MEYFGACDQVKIGEFAVCWNPRQDNFGDYNSKHNDTQHHQMSELCTCMKEIAKIPSAIFEA